MNQKQFKIANVVPNSSNFKKEFSQKVGSYTTGMVMSYVPEKKHIDITVATEYLAGDYSLGNTFSELRKETLKRQNSFNPVKKEDKLTKIFNWILIEQRKKATREQVLAYQWKDFYNNWDL